MNSKIKLVFIIVIVFVFSSCASNRKQGQIEIKSIEIRIDYGKVNVDKVISELSKQMSLTMLEQKKKRVAVMNFTTPNGEITELGIYLSDKLTNSLFQYKDQFEIVERTKIESTFKEMQLSFSGVIDNNTAQSVGKVLGADSIIIGTITDLQNNVDISVRMLGTERANVVAVAGSLLKKNDAIDKLIKNIVMESGKIIVKENKPVPVVTPVEKAYNTKEKGLTAYYPFNGNANDESVNRNNGTIYGATLTTDRLENANKAYSFNGVDNEVKVPYATNLNPLQALTLDAWVNINSLANAANSGYQGVVSMSEGQRAYTLCITGTGVNHVGTAGNVHLEGSGIGSAWRTSVAIITPGQWYHIAGVIEPSTNRFEIYVNGVLQPVVSSRGRPQLALVSNIPFRIGNSDPGFSYQFNGFIDEVEVYKRALSAAEIESIFNLGRQ